MAQGGDEASEPPFRLVKQTELTHHRSPVIVDAIAGKSVLGIEGVNTAKREFHASAGCRHTAPPDAQVGALNRDLKDDRIARYAPPIHEGSLRGLTRG